MSRRAWLAVAAVVILANAAKFVYLDADFPRGLTTSRALYTDEGWYSMNAVNAATGKPWYSAGEWNTAINLPVGPLLQTGVFHIFGTSLASARGLVAAASVLLVGAAFGLGRLYLPGPSASLLAVLLSLDFFLFGYARLAILDLTMTAVVMLAFWAAAAIDVRRVLLAAMLAGTLLGIAALTKTTALCAVPALAYLSSARVDDRRRRWLVAAFVLMPCGLITLGYNLAAWHAFPSDYLAFHAFAEGEGLASGPLDALRNAGLAFVNMVRAEPVVATLALATVALLRRSAAFRANLLVRASVVWILAFVVMLAFRNYQPSRYFVVVAVPLHILFCAGTGHLADLPVPAWFGQTARAIAVGGLVGLNAGRIVGYVTDPSYSFVTMAREVAAIVNHPAGDRGSGVLLGDMAPSLSIERRISATSMGHTPEGLAAQIVRHCPTYFITLESDRGHDVHALSEYYAVEPVGHWNVLGNYYEGRPVRLFRLHARGLTPLCDHS